MTFKIFKDVWDLNKHSTAQIDLAYAFLHLLDECVTLAHQEAESFQLDGDFPKAAQFYRRAEGFSKGLRTREYKGSARVFKASFGSAIEERAYQLLNANDSVWVEDYLEWDDFNFATELQLPDVDSGFPHSFKGRGASKGSRPDVRLALGDGFEALFDITSDSIVSQGHINKKGAAGWLTRVNVPFIAEVYYTAA